MNTDREEANTFILTILLVGIFLGFGGIIGFGIQTFIYIDTIFHFWLFTGLVVLGIHFIFFRKWNRYFAEIAAYSFFGWASTIIALLLAVNFLFHGAAQTQTYLLKDNKVDLTIYNGSISVVHIGFADEEMEKYKHMLRFTDEDIYTKVRGEQLLADRAIYTTAQGFFGYKILLHKEIR